MKIVRKLFIVPLADNNHGKTTIIHSLVEQGIGQQLHQNRKSSRQLVSPSGREFNAYVYGRSFQETEKRRHASVQAALDADDSDWRHKDLIIMPSHISDIKSKTGVDDIEQMIDAGHSANFDVICALIAHDYNIDTQKSQLKKIFSKQWDERWTILNPKRDDFDGQLEALGRNLWFRIAGALTS